MAKTVSLPPVRVEPELRDALRQISELLGVSVYELIRQTLVDYVQRSPQLSMSAPAVLEMGANGAGMGGDDE